MRKPPDQSLAAGSPGNIAGSSVLHRLLVPRHPPCALKNLTHCTTKCLLANLRRLQKMLASTVQFSRNGRNQSPPQHIRATRRSWPFTTKAPGRKRLFPQDPTVCSPGSRFTEPVPSPPRGGERTSRSHHAAAE